MPICAVYEIRHRLHDDVTYIGSSVNVRRRFAEHRSTLRRGIHWNDYLQRSWNKYGEGSFEFSIIETVADKAAMIEREQWHLTRAGRRVYNIAEVAGRPMLGRTHTPEVRAATSARNKGFVLTPEHKAALLAANLGHKRSRETRAKQSAAGKGRKLSPEHRAKLLAASLGRKASTEARAKMSAARKGRVRGPMSEEQKAKISATKVAAHRRGLDGRPHTPETRAKLRALAMGRTVSAEARQKQSESMRAVCAVHPRWARKKATAA